MRKYFDKWTVSLFVLAGLLVAVNVPYKTTWAGIIQAIIPQAVPTANKIGNSTKFQLGTGTSSAGDCAEFDGNGNIVTAGAACSASSSGSAGATLFSTTDSTTVTAASATTLIGTVTGSTTIPANTFTAGSVLELLAEGYYTTPVAARTLTIDLLIGGSTRISTGAVTVLPSVTNGVWKLHCGVTTRTTGASGSQIANCIFHMAPSSASVLTPADASMQTSSTWTVDTTGTLAVDLKATWDSTTGSPSITSSNIAGWIPGAPVTSVGGATGAVKSGFQGNGSLIQLSTGSTTTDNCVKFDANGNTVDAGAACGSGSGGFVLVEQHTASTAASLDFTTCISSTYDTYQFELVSIIPDTSTANLLMRAGTGAGPTWDTGSNYAWSRLIVITNGSGAGGSSSDTSMEILHSAVTTANQTINGTVKLFDPAASTFKNTTGLIQGMETINNQPSIWINDGTYKSTTAVTGWRFFFSSGNIASGTIRCYGIAK